MVKLFLVIRKDSAEGVSNAFQVTFNLYEIVSYQHSDSSFLCIHLM